MGTTVFERRRADPAQVQRSLAGSRHDVFWLDDVRRPRYPALGANARTDLVVVGGGYNGLWTAIRAKERDPGTRVILVEANRIGWAASGRNGGFCEATLTHGRQNGLTRWPDEMTTLDRLGNENLAAIIATVRRYSLDVDLEETGVLKVAVEPHQIPWVRDEHSDADHVYLEGAELQAQVASPTYLAASWDRRGNVLVHPAKLALELARVAEKLGVEIFEHTPAHDVRRDGGGVTVQTDGATIRADRAAIATNVFPSLIRRTRLLTVPVYDYVLATEPLTAEQLSRIGWAERQGIADLANQFHYYRRAADDRVVFGGYDAVYHPGGRVRARYEDRAASFERLAAHFFTTFPQLADVRFSHRWAGPIDTCSRFCAYFGTARGGRVAYSAGFTGLGVAATRFAADVLLDLLSGERTERTALEMVRRKPIPFPPEPAASIGIAATKWSLDRADHDRGRRNLLLRAMDAVGMGFDS
ncbi:MULTISPECIES: FAD-binding oxidoreductase [Microbacterium]|uniref:NAD(P)/FAD-dependent oxidoreductase n=1 Tax=Microbacterium TaxID=33882 RepID=UPI002785C591|nr:MULTISPECIES: FAD-dependent oxidoreductase [Microbacterium]MDQ1075182.1 glycine/D-amino acid oxidase-like deaminating enzyme [Microbacterium sp. SORGH_AS_0969]MDQ1115412.1 glycine/D-amino acid oxidase-like deaminating enzyme [Microbacterium testaceum]